MEKIKVTVELPDWMVNRILNPRDEKDIALAGAWLFGAVLVELEPIDA